jgi:Icc-related predicted phosphoesterase
MSVKPTITVIDDQLEMRQAAYDSLLKDNFIIDYIHSEAELTKLRTNNQIKMIVIDYNLENWSLKTMDRVLEKHASELIKTIPIIIVSIHWNDDKGHPISDLADLFRKYNVISVFSWEDLTANYYTTIKTWQARFVSEFDRYWDYVPQLPSPESSVTILQIADLQFGDTVAPGSFADRYGISAFLRNKSIKPDLIAVCGDITYSGKGEEFSEAKNWFDEFDATLGLWAEKRRYLFTVGNHDCNIDAFAQYKYSYNFETKKFEDPPEGIIWREDGQSIFSTEEVIFQGFQYFESSYHIGAKSNWQTNKLYAVNDSFINWGIRIINLNTVSNISPANPQGIGIIEDELSAIIKYCTSTAWESDLFTIVLSHFPPSELGYENGDMGKQEQWAKISNLLSSINANIWLCGHIHSFKRGKLQLNYEDAKDDVPYAITGSLRLAPAKLAPDAKLGFNIITLERQNGSINRIKMASWKIEGGLPSPFGEELVFEVFAGDRSHL